MEDAADGEELAALPDADNGDSPEGEPPESRLVNLFANDPPAFMSPGNGRMCTVMLIAYNKRV